MKKYYIILLIIISFNVYSQNGVGINETNPQQQLHLGSATGTIRVESLNYPNSEFNGGGSDTYPLYADGNGNLTTEFKPLYNSNGSDALDHAILPGATITLPAGDNDGVIVGELFNFTINVNRASILEVKYNVSMDIFSTPAEVVILDRRARRINTYFQVNGAGRKYGQAAKSYTSGTSDSETGKLYNTSTSYITLPAAGTYVIRFYGEVSSGIRASTANTGLATCVKFARGNDSLLFRLH